jgi:hypothetical protein
MLPAIVSATPDRRREHPANINQKYQIALKTNSLDSKKS